MIATIGSIQHNFVPPTINLVDADPTCDLDYVPNEGQSATNNTALSNSFGFGGHNTALVVRKFHTRVFIGIGTNVGIGLIIDRALGNCG